MPTVRKNRLRTVPICRCRAECKCCKEEVILRCFSALVHKVIFHIPRSFNGFHDDIWLVSFMEAFDADTNVPRLVLLLSPT